jgi:16S rRNA (cytosine967-C5)-methyltransferase
MPEPKPNPGLIARTNALTLLRQVLDQRQPLDEALVASGSYALLETRDRAFVRLLVATTLRRLGQIDSLIRHCLDRPLPPETSPVQNILRLGITQIVILNTPAHAVVDTAVRLCIQNQRPGQKGLVNAVLRRLVREGPKLFADQDAANLNTPSWLWESWTKAYGKKICRRIAEAHLHEAPLNFTAAGDPEACAKQLGAKLLPGGTLRLDAGGGVTQLPGFDEGAWWVQDAAASLPAKLLLGALGGGDGRLIVDLCAAPGGKTAQLATSGARVIAVDRSKNRLSILTENMKRLGLDVEVVTADATEWRASEPPDGILLDAPCTATGTIRRHPDIVHSKQPKDVERLADLQKRLIATAADQLKPGGILVYSVCSLQPEEGLAIVQNLLAERGDLRRRAIKGREMPGLEGAITPEGDVRTLPCHMQKIGGMDGFYIARLQRGG